MQESIKKLQILGRLPDSDSADIQRIKDFQDLIESIRSPISDEEAIALLDVFGIDECFGLIWPLIHQIETAPNWPIWPEINKRCGYGIDLIKARAAGR